MKNFHYLSRLALLFCLVWASFGFSTAKAQENSEKLFIYQQLQTQLKKTRGEQKDLESFLCAALANLQTLEVNFSLLKNEQAVLAESLTNCKTSLTASQTAYNSLLGEKVSLEVKLQEEREKRKKTLIIGVVAGVVIACAGGVAIGIIAGRAR